MKKCMNCGAELTDDAKFCHTCGAKQEEAAPLSGQETASVNVDEMSREELVSRLNEAFAAVQQVYELADHQTMLQRKLKNAAGFNNIKLIRYLIAFLAADVLSGLAVKITAAFFPPVLALILGFAVFIGVIFFGARFMKEGLGRDLLEEALSSFGAGPGKTAEYQAEIENVQYRMNTIWNSNAENICCLPKDYRYPLAYQYTAMYLEQKRANSVGEALNLFDEQTHRWKMEDAQNQILRNQRDMQVQLALMDLDLILSGR